METLLEYLTFVKGIGYLLVIAFLVAFLAFWKLIMKENETAKIVPVIAILIMWISFGAVAIFFIPSKGVTEKPVTPRPEKWLNVNSSEYLSINYGSASKFHEVMSKKLECKTCHHNSDEIRACNDCHSTPFNPEDINKHINKPGLKAAIHQRCMECHRELFTGPKGCKLCHTGEPPVSLVIPSMPHELTWENCTMCHKEIPGGGKIKVVYHDFCVKCHTKGIANATKLPLSHANLTSDTCKGCHKRG